MWPLLVALMVCPEDMESKPWYTPTMCKHAAAPISPVDPSGSVYNGPYATTNTNTSRQKHSRNATVPQPHHPINVAESFANSLGSLPSSNTDLNECTGWDKVVALAGTSNYLQSFYPGKDDVVNAHAQHTYHMLTYATQLLRWSSLFQNSARENSRREWVKMDNNHLSVRPLRFIEKKVMHPTDGLQLEWHHP